MHVMGGGDVGGAKTQIMNTVTGLSRTNDVMLISFRAGPFADEARERGIDVRVIERHNPFRAARTMRDLVDEFKPDIIRSSSTPSARQTLSRCAFSTSISRSRTAWRARSSSAALTRSAS